MTWATHYIERLKAGETVSFRPRGNSMIPKIRSGDLCTVGPLAQPPSRGDIVLCKVAGRQYLHVVTAIRGDLFQISNNQGRVNGWCSRQQIFGILERVDA